MSMFECSARANLFSRPISSAASNAGPHSSFADMKAAASCCSESSRLRSITPKVGSGSVAAGGIRMLIRGDLVTADLPRSWFYSRADHDEQDDRDPPER